MNKFQELYETVVEKKWAKKVKPEKGKMKKVLGIPDDKEISDVYSSGKKLAKDLTDKVGLKDAKSMLAFAANVNKKEDVFDVALRNLPENITESGEEEKMLLQQKRTLQDAMRNDTGKYPEENKIRQEKIKSIDKKIKLAKEKENISQDEERIQNEIERLNKKKANDAKNASNETTV